MNVVKLAFTTPITIILLLYSHIALLAQCPSPYDHVVLNEVSGDAGQSDGVDDAIVEIGGPAGTDIGCMVISNSEWAIVIPEGTTMPADGTYLIACASRTSSDRGVGIKGVNNGLACDECDFPGLPIDFDVCDPINIVYCDFSATGFTLDNQHSADGDQVMLFRPNGTPHDAIYWGESNSLTRGGATTGGASGDADHVTVQDPTKGSYLLGSGVVPMGRGDGGIADTSAVPVMPNGAGCMASQIAYSMPNLTDPIWVKHPSATFTGCNSSYLRIANSSGTHGNPSHKPTAGDLIPYSNLIPSSCDPSGALAQWGYTDHPNPGVNNDAVAWNLTVTDTVLCAPGSITFTLEVFNWQHVSDNQDTLSGACDENIGSYVMAPITDPKMIAGPLSIQSWESYSVDPFSGITTMTYTSGILPIGKHCFTLQWDDYSNCCGSTSKTSNGECYERQQICIEIIAPLAYDCDGDQIADNPQTPCVISCADGDPHAGVINAKQYIIGGSDLCFTLIDSAGVLPPKTNTTGVFLLENIPASGGYYIVVNDKSGCGFADLNLGISNDCEAAALCPSNFMTDSSSASGLYCPSDTLQFCLKADNLPMNGIIEYYIGPWDCAWQPGDATSEKVGEVIIEAPSCENCPAPVDLNPGGTCGDGGGIIVNEFSQGQSGNREWVELLVVGQSCSTVNLNGWILNDNDLSCGSAGIAPGYIWFDSSRPGCTCDFSAVPVGSRIIIYNEEEKETCLPADDPCDSNGDKVYILPANHPCLATCYNTDAFPCPTANTNPGGLQQGWQNGTSTSSGLLLGNTSDCFITKCPNNQIYHGIEYGAANCGSAETNITCASSTNGSGSQEYIIKCGDYYADTAAMRQSFTSATACTVQTPGLANNASNSMMINRLCEINGSCFVEPLSQNCIPVPPIWYCLDYVIPQEACPSDSFCLKAKISPLSSSCDSIVAINRQYIISCPSADLKPRHIDTCFADLPAGLDLDVMVMNGAGPFKLCWSRSDEPGINHCLTGSGPNFTIHIDGPTDGEIKVKLDSIVDLGGAKCQGEVDNDEACINLRPEPTASITDHKDISSCATGCGSVTITFEGTGPYTFVYCLDGGAEMEVFVADNVYIIEACQPGTYKIKSFFDDFGCGGQILNDEVDVLFQGNVPVVDTICIPQMPVCGDSLVCHDLDTLVKVVIDTNGINPGQLDTAMVAWFRYNPKLSGFDPVAHLITDGIIKIKDTTTYYFIYTHPITGCMVCDSATIYADFLACCMPPSIICPRDTFYPPGLCNIVPPAPKSVFRRDTVGLGGRQDTIPVILNGCGSVMLSSRDSVVTSNCLRTIYRFYIAVDSIGFRDSCVQQIGYTFDTIPPTPMCPSNVSLQCPGDTAVANTGIGTAMDNCMSPVQVSYRDSVINGSCPNEKTIFRKWTFTDACLNSSMCTQSIFIIDTLPPKFIPSTKPRDTMVACEFVFPANTYEAFDTCQLTSGGRDIIKPWINEIHYDDVGTDTFEFIEIAGLAGDNLAGYSLVLYNGADSSMYNTMNLGGMIDNEGSCMGALVFAYPINGIQNGAPDGIALVNGATVCEFISYEGSFRAKNGPAAGIQSVDIGVLEAGSDPTGLSLQKKGSGNMGGQFTWNPVSAWSPGAINTGQTITPPPACMGGTANVDTFATVYRYDSLPGRCPNEYTLVRKWFATDSCGNVDSLVQRIMVKDTSKPMICSPLTLPQSMSVSCSRVPAMDTITGIDLCDKSLLGNIWINEIHYDNAGTDTLEFIEIAGFFGTNLAQYKLMLYNGSTGLVYDSMSLSGILPNEKCGYGALAFYYPVNGIQNGSPDGIALVKGITVLQFISYEGTFLAVNGPAAGLFGSPISSSENGSTPYTQSIQLTGCGDAYSDFVWTGPIDRTPGLLNPGQIVKGNIVSYGTERRVRGICPVKDTIYRNWSLSDRCGNTFTWSQRIISVDTSKPIAICRNLTAYLNKQGMSMIRSADLDGGSYDSCSATLRFLATDTTFNCFDRGDHLVTLFVYDECNNSSSCISTVSVVDTFPPMLFCKDRTFFANPGDCEAIVHINISDIAMDNCDQNLMIIQDPSDPFKLDSFFPIGKHLVRISVMDQDGNIAYCEFYVEVMDYPSPIVDLFCNNSIQISLDANCSATIGADDILEGGPYRCYDSYRVEVRDWNTLALIDRMPGVPGSQIGRMDIGRPLKITVFDTVSGNSCWSHATVEDKLAPVLVCVPDIVLTCGSSEDPINTGTPLVTDNCGIFTLSYKDNATPGSCSLGFEKQIVRTWIASDQYGNKVSCQQLITINIGDLADVIVPQHFDGLPGNQSMLNCNEKKDTLKDLTPHYAFDPLCVDGYLLDSAYWKATGGDTALGDFSGMRRPRILGWNCIDSGIYKGHPSPYPVYYPPHPDWTVQNPRCWGPDTYILWKGTGLPQPTGCRNFGSTFQDVIIDLAKPNCNAGSIGCYKVLRKWTVMDWCTGEVGGHNQIIKVGDPEGPEILYPDSIVVQSDVWTCSGTWEVPKPWLTDNCSQDIHYTMESLDGVISGSEKDGYLISDLELGKHNIYIVAEDCCGNLTKKLIRVNVLDNTPPVPVCIKSTVVSLVADSHIGENITKIFATSFDDGSFDNCARHVYVKTIRMEELNGTVNGRTPSFDNRISCNGLNGDDDPDPVFAPGNQVYFDDFVKFCCADVGQKIMVVLRVFDVDPGAGPIHPNRMGRSGPNLGNTGDLFGHYSDCMVEVEVQDKVVPTLIPPPNIVVSCWFWYDFEKLRDPLDPTFGRVVTDLSARAKVKTNDLVCQRYCVPNTLHNYPGPSAGAVPPNLPAANIACNYYNSLYNPAHPDNKYELVWGFDGYVTGGCNVSVTVTPNDDNVKCGQGVLTRTFTVRTSTGVTLSRQQTIWIVDCDPFYVNPADYCDPNDDIEWPTCISASLPGRVELDGCGADLSPDNPRLGRPKVMNNADDNCALIAIEYDDEVFTIEPDACLKVIRTWTVIDWCQYDPSRNILTGRWEYQQVIKVRDNDDPVITIIPSNCEPASKNPQTQICEGHILLRIDVSDNCTPKDWLKWEYKIDLFADGKGKYGNFDHIVGSLTQREYENGGIVKYKDNPYADNPANPLCADGTYPIGVHRIKWVIEDGCGNVTVKEDLFEIKDCKAPTPYCLSGIVTTVMPSTGCITIWAKDFDHGSYDNCTPPANLKIYFEGGSDSLLICCSDFEEERVNDELILPVKICVEDEEGNKDCCETTMIVQDPNNVCPDDGTFNGKVYGAIKTNNGSETSDTDVELMKNGQLMKEMMTLVDGKYTFSNLIEGQDYVIKPERNDNYLNGVSTADIVKIQKHILGQEEFTDPVQFIAADVNKSKTITASDISEIRKLILGVTSKFTKTPSWWIIPSDHVFSDPTQPFDFPISKEIKNLQSENKVDFMSVKVGDVNQTARAHFGQNVESRTGAKLRLEMKEQEIKAGESYEIEVSSKGFESITGFQYTISFDARAIEIVSVESGSLTIEEKNLNLGRTSEGILTMSWDNSRSQTVAQGETLYKMRLQAMKGGKLSRLMSITGDLTSSEAYDKEGNLKEVVLDVRNSDTVVESG
ncbi:MAG: HYR domain-containing protein, partial [Saprospiraceae bacterium]|nr:HYR domain-containing protein [Saprospiraceae bacterium]